MRDSWQTQRVDSRQGRDVDRARNLYQLNKAASQATAPSGILRDPHAGIGHIVIQPFRR
jgi:hypothetical protein